MPSNPLLIAHIFALSKIQAGWRWANKDAAEACLCANDGTSVFFHPSSVVNN